MRQTNTKLKHLYKTLDYNQRGCLGQASRRALFINMIIIMSFGLLCPGPDYVNTLGELTSPSGEGDTILSD